MLGELERERGVVVFDMEAGAGTLLRMKPGTADVVLVVAEPSAKSIEVARRLLEISARQQRVVVLANKVRSEDEVDEIRAALSGHELVAIPYDEAIERGDREGRAPLDLDPEGPGIRALEALGEGLSTN